MAGQIIIQILLSLIVVNYGHSAELYDYGTDNGDTEVTTVNDGYKEIQFTQGFPYYGYLFKKTFINENGLLSMVTPVNEAEWKKVLPIAGDIDNNGDGKVETDGADARILIAPFWANIDVTEGGKVYYRQITTDNDTTSALERAANEIRKCFLPEFDFTPNHGIIVTWDEVSFFGHDSSTTDPTNTFQLVLASDGQESFAFFLYKEITWNAGTESQGDPEHGKSDRGATIGFNVGDPFLPLIHQRSSKDANTQLQIVNSQNCPSLSRGTYIYKIDPTELVEAGCDNDGDLTVFPAVGSMFGGEEIFLVGPCWDSQVELTCRFKYNDDVIQEVTGKRLDEEKASCIPKPFFLSGELTIELEVSSADGSQRLLSQTYYVANLDHIQSSGVTRDNPTWENWEKAELPLTVRWETSEFDENTTLSISTLVYLEDGTQGPQWEEVFVIAQNATNDGAYKFEGTPITQVYEGSAFGAIRIRSTEDTEGRTLWSDVHTLGYILNQEYQDNPRSWSSAKCDQWATDDERLRDFVKEVLACPCTLEQAIVDVGRFQPAVSCSMYSGGKCLHHEGAKHCVMSVAATEDTNSGTECCYNQNGDLMYAGDYNQGSTSHRSHAWGAEPYQKAGMVPGLSHWKHDVIPFYLCCLWSDDCKTYLDLRPTADCKAYEPPKSSATFGDPHFVTFDGVKYTFNGKGEFTMVHERDSEFELQGRTEQAECSCENSTEYAATVLTAIAVQEKNSDIIHVELSPITGLKFVRKVSGAAEVVDFYDQQWLDYNGVSLVVVKSERGIVNKATITFWNSGIGVNVTANGQTLAVAVTLPPSMKGKTTVKGLLGNWDDKTNNDLADRNGKKLNPDTATPQQILASGITWDVETPLFYYYGTWSHEDYQDDDFEPIFEVPDRSTLPSDLVQDMDRVCGTTNQCIYDVSVTGDISVGENTMAALNTHNLATEYTEPVVACPYLQTPQNGTKTYKSDQQNYLEGAVVQFQCEEGLEVKGPAERTCQENGKWSGKGETKCVVPGEGGSGSQTSNTVGIAVGVVVAVIVLIVIVVIIVVVYRRKKKEQDPEAGTEKKGKTKKDYKEVKMSDVKEDEPKEDEPKKDEPKEEGKDEAPPGEEEPMNLDEATSAPKSDED